MTASRKAKLNLLTLQILMNMYLNVHENQFCSFGEDRNNKLHLTGR